jgi:hypothetical protein
VGAERRVPGRRPQEPAGEPAEQRSDLHFHYRRSERLSRPGSPRLAPQQGFLRRYRGLLIVLADIAVLVILGFVFLRFFGPPDASGRVGPYTTTLRGLEYGQTIFATVTVRLEGAAAPGVEGRVFVRFALARNAADAEAQFDSAPLPAEEQEAVVLKAGLPFDERPHRLYAEVRIGDRSVHLSFALDS